MNVISNKEAHWRRFPELRRIFNDSRTPDRFPFDDLHDLAEIGAIVGSGQGRLAASIQQVSPNETPHEQMIRIERLLHDLDHLQGALHSLFDEFLREHDRELDELRKQLLNKLH